MKTETKVYICTSSSGVKGCKEHNCKSCTYCISMVIDGSIPNPEPREKKVEMRGKKICTGRNVKEYSFGFETKEFLKPRDLLAIFGMTVSNNYLKLHGGIMERSGGKRKCGYKKKKRRKNL